MMRVFCPQSLYVTYFINLAQQLSFFSKNYYNGVISGHDTSMVIGFYNS